MIDFNCPFCNKPMSVPSSLAGQKNKCPNCSAIVNVPKPSRHSSLDDLASIAGQISKPRQPITTSSIQGRKCITHAPRENKAYGAATLVLFVAASVLFFTPWLDMMVAKVSPASFVFNVGKFMSTSSKSKESSEIDEQPSNRAPTDETSSNATKGAFMLAASFFIYAGGIFVGIFGGFQILNRWRSAFSVIGFCICLFACLLTFVGWHMLIPDSETSRKIESAAGIAGFGLTPWFYATIFVSILGIGTSVCADIYMPKNRVHRAI